MNFITQIERFQTLKKLITQRKTGTPCELAERLGVSKRQIHNLIEELKLMGLNVEYCKRNKTYFYAQEQRLEINFSVNVLLENELQKIYGARKQKISECNFIALYDSTFTTYRYKKEMLTA